MIQHARSTSAATIYLDSSAYLERLVVGRRHAQVERLINGQRWISSVLLVLETQRTLMHLARQGKLSASQYDQALERFELEFEGFTFHELTLEICRTPKMPATSTPRSLDLVHLRTALWFQQHGPLHQFVTLDEPQRYAAKELGLPV